MLLSRTELEFDIECEFIGALDGVSNIRLVGRCRLKISRSQMELKEAMTHHPNQNKGNPLALTIPKENFQSRQASGHGKHQTPPAYPKIEIKSQIETETTRSSDRGKRVTRSQLTRQNEMFPDKDKY